MSPDPAVDAILALHDYCSTSARMPICDAAFHLKGIEPGTYTVSLHVDGQPRARASGVEVVAGKETGPVELRVE